MTPLENKERYCANEFPANSEIHFCKFTESPCVGCVFAPPEISGEYLSFEAESAFRCPLYAPPAESWTAKSTAKVVLAVREARMESARITIEQKTDAIVKISSLTNDRIK